MKLINSSLDPNSYADTISETLEQVESEIGQRQVQKSKCKVFELSRTAENPFVPSGAVMAVIGIKGNETLKLIADALHKDDVRLISEIRNVFGETHRKIQTLIEKGSLTSIPQRFKQRDKFGTIAEIRYGDKTLINYCTVNYEFPLNIQLFPYNGGMLEYDNFDLVEYFYDDDEKLECILFVNKPILSKMEEKALSLLPSSESSINIGTGLFRFFPAVIAAAANGVDRLFVKAVDKSCFLLMAHMNGVRSRRTVRIIESEGMVEILNHMPPEATAKELLLLRKKLLELEISYSL